MDKLYNHPWFVKIISFFIAVMLFAMVNVDIVNNQPGVLPAVKNGSYTIEEVPLNIFYNAEEYAITEIDDHVQVNLSGPQNLLNLIKLERPSYEVFIDLRGLGTGNHTVNVQYEGFPNELTAVTIVPQTVSVTIEEKRTISLPIQIDLINEADLEEGYEIGSPIVNPVNVEITAAESIVSQVASAKGFVDIKDMKQTLEKSVPIKVYDEQGDELNIDVNPTVVDVKVPLISPSKEVPLKLQRVGELPEGLSISTIYAEPKDVTIFGPKTIIDEISLIEGIEIDLTEITKNTILEVKVPKPDGVEKVLPDIVKVVIEVDTEETVEFEDINIEIIGLSDRISASFLESEKMYLTAKGSPSAIESLIKEDINMYIDVNQLPIGVHTVPVQINGPQNITFEMNFDKVVVKISKVVSADQETSTEVVEETS